ncbi:hypothetical protein C499_19590 [Halogeometricum borinquense DSM 11551]|uniref:Uncharacterized protein n=1 Tax=Halogeometricum borinquense (strain ATCC 700274 / DSM 11551 / JCM 10706 / KCTC 4070 / PR3) TaxID=469382 RepID=E4NWU1_HALBP|nr:hypothetical protein [Halogeometricum borinquense]ADQ69511.1 hypothetical protein Hbor_38060 [Halogeometricum borinquense DSM 11551]ELY23058.1 hypothetical protein C499_19590 [Halogeometricum borinquense DSM 11551]
MSDDDTAEITVTYRPDDQRAEVRCDYPGDDPEDRDDRVRQLFEAVYEAASDELEDEGLHVIAGGEVTDAENAVAHSFGTDDDVPTI